MEAIKKGKNSKKSIKSHSAPVINDDLKKYHDHPVIQKKMERGRKMMGL